MTYSLHPQVLSSLIIIRNKPELVPGSCISTLALFTVERLGRREARFDIIHHAFDRDTPRVQILSALCRSLPQGGELLVRAPALNAATVRRAKADGHPPPPTDLDLIRRLAPEQVIVPLTVTDAHITASGEELGLEMPGPGSTALRRRRRAPEQAMALWAIYTTGFCRKPEARVLFAGFQAWRVLQEARALPF